MEYLTDFSAKRAELAPERIAFREGRAGRGWSFAEVDAAAARLAGGLLAAGLAAGERLAMLCQNRIEFFIALFAAQKSGIILAPLNWRQPAAELAAVVHAVGVSALIHSAKFGATATALAEMFELTLFTLEGTGAHSWSALTSHAPAPARRVRADETWYLLFTSGHHRPAESGHPDAGDGADECTQHRSGDRPDQRRYQP